MKCEKCGKKLPDTLDYCPTCRMIEAKHKNNQKKTLAVKPGEVMAAKGERDLSSKLENSVIVTKAFNNQDITPNTRVTKTKSKCPKCGSTDILFYKEQGLIRCNFCRYDFKSLQKEEDDIANI